MRFLFAFFLCFCFGADVSHAQTNLIPNGDFSQELSGWDIFPPNRDAAIGQITVVDAQAGAFTRAARVVVKPKPNDPHHALGMKVMNALPLHRSDKVVLKVWMRSPDNLKVTLLLEENREPWAAWAQQEVTLTPQWKEYEVIGQSPRDFGILEADAAFWFAHSSGTIEVAGAHLLASPLPELDLQFGHAGGVKCVAYSPDGKTIATGGNDGTVKLWNSATGQLIRTIRVRFNASTVLDVVFSPDGKTFATGCQDTIVDLWDVQTGSKEKQFNNNRGWEGAVAFSPDGKLLACLDLSEDLKTEMIYLRDVKTGEIRRTLKGSGGAIGIDFSPDGRLLVTGSWDGKVRIWDTTTGELKHTLLNPEQTAYDVDFSPDGKIIAGAIASNTSRTLRLWDARSGELLKTLVHDKFLSKTAFSPDGKMVVGAGDGIQLWDVHSGELVRKWAPDKIGIGKLAFSPDGNTLAVGGNDTTTDLWDVSTGMRQKVLGFNATVPSVAIAPDGKSFASSHGDQNVRLWNSQTGELQKIIAAGGVDALVFLDGGKRLATGSRYGTLRVWDVASGNALKTWDETPQAVRALALSPDGGILASGGDEKVIKLRDASTGELLSTFDIGADIYTLSFSPDGSKLACGTHGEYVKVLDANSGAVLRTLTGFTWIVSSVAFSPDGKLLATSSWGGTLKICDAATGQQLWSNQIGGNTRPLKFSADGTSLICGEAGRIIVFDAKTGKDTRILLSRGGNIETLCLSPDQRTFITGGEDSIKMWDNASGRLLATIVALPPQSALAGTKPLTADARALTAEARSLTADARDVGSSGDYLVVTSDGYYSGSATIDRYVHFKLFDDSFPAECFQSRYYRPDLVKLALSGGIVPPIGDFKGAYPPLARFTTQTAGAVAGNTASVTVETSDDSAVQSMAFFVNGARVEGKETATQGRPLTADARGLSAEARALTAEARPLTADARALPTAHKVTRTFTATLPLPADAESVKIQAIAFDDDGLQSPRTELTLTHTLGAVAKGQLLGLCVGVSRYKDARLNLRYADADANALAADFNLQKGLYSPTAVLALTNEWATSAAVTAALDTLIKGTTSADTVVISLSGHGWRDEKGKFYFATTEVDRNDVARTALSWDEVVSRLTRLSEKSKRVIVLLDACHSGSAATNEEMVKAILGANAGVLVFASSRGSEVSLENAEWAHGAFTKALLEAARGLAAPEDEKHVTTIDFIAYVSRRVKALTENQQHPQVPFLQDFDTDSPIVSKP